MCCNVVFIAAEPSNVPFRLECTLKDSGHFTIITTQDCLLGCDLEKCQIVQQNLNYLPPSVARRGLV